MQSECQEFEGNKKKYKGTFNWHNEIHELYNHAVSEQDAFGLFVTKLAGKLGYNLNKVRMYFSYTPNSYKIEETKDSELSGIKTPSFPITINPLYIDDKNDFICMRFGYNEEMTQFFFEFPFICNYVKEYTPSSKFKSDIGPMSPQKAKEMEKKVNDTIKEAMRLIENRQFDEAIKIIEFLKLKF